VNNKIHNNLILKKRKAFIKLVLLALICSMICCKSDTHLYSLLTSNNCYWDVHSDNSIPNCYQFNTDSTCTYFSYDGKGARVKFDFDPNLRTDKTWKLQGDTTFYILGLKSKVLSYSADSIVIQNLNTGLKELLTRNCN
jgi:uncharacterized protein YxeA